MKKTMKTAKKAVSNILDVKGNFAAKGNDLICAVIGGTNASSLEKGKQRMFDYFIASKITPAQLMGWLAEANSLIANTESLTKEERSCSGTFLWWIGSCFMPTFIDSTASQKALAKTFWEAFTSGYDYDYYREGISNIGIAFLRQKGASSLGVVKDFMRPLSMFREIIEILWDYEISDKIEKKSA